MKRLIYNKLIEWKVRANRKPLILEGARQVGKTYILQEFGKNEFDNMVYINCDNNDAVKQLFAIDYDIARILRGLSTLASQPIEAGKTLLFLDEIQELPGGLTSLKYFCENARKLHVVVAGSLLGISNSHGQSFPVGKVEFMHLFPMSFQEFLMARGKNLLLDALQNLDWGIITPLHNVFVEELRQYYFVGGMPEAVLNYVENKSTDEVRVTHMQILEAYMRDFAKHAGKDTQRVRMVWESVPGHLARENKKFIFGAVKPGARASYFDNALQWLQDAGLIYKVENLSQIELPLKFNANRDFFKAFMLDIGLLASITLTPASEMLTGNNAFGRFKGAFTENYVLQQLKTIEPLHIFYYSKPNSTLEIDFICQIDNRILPIEVKAETNVKSKSLTTFAKTHEAKIKKSLRFSMQPHIDQHWMENVPLYAVGAFMENLIKNENI